MKTYLYTERQVYPGVFYCEYRQTDSKLPYKTCDVPEVVMRTAPLIDWYTDSNGGDWDIFKAYGALYDENYEMIAEVKYGEFNP